MGIRDLNSPALAALKFGKPRAVHFDVHRQFYPLPKLVLRTSGGDGARNRKNRNWSILLIERWNRINVRAPFHTFWGMGYLIMLM